MSERIAKIDVLLPVYNAASTIEEAVRSVLTQTVEDLRVIVVDDGSTDHTAEILASLAAEDPRIEVLSRPNGGLVAALNAGLARCTAPLIARHDADDISFPDRLEAQAAYLESHTDVVAVSGSCVHIDANGQATGSHFQPCDPDLADDRALPALEPYLLHPFLMLRRSAITRVGGYRNVWHAEDSDLYWRLREIGRLANMARPLGKMRLHHASVSNASVVNGRIMAVHSQLAAISARRRAEGRPDLRFDTYTLDTCRQARGLEAILDIASMQLTSEEQRHLRKAASVKLLELATGRSYEIEVEDCSFIREAYDGIAIADIRGRSVASWAYRATLARLARRLAFDQLRALMTPGLSCRMLVCRLL